MQQFKDEISNNGVLELWQEGPHEEGFLVKEEEGAGVASEQAHIGSQCYHRSRVRCSHFFS